MPDVCSNIGSYSCTFFAWGVQINWGMPLFFALFMNFYYLCGPVVHAVLQSCGKVFHLVLLAV